MAHDEFRRLIEETAPMLDSRLVVEIERDGAMDDAASEMAIDDGFITVLAKERFQLPKIIAELIGRDCAVLPSRPGVGVVRHVGFRSEGIVAHVPDPLLLVLVSDE